MSKNVNFGSMLRKKVQYFDMPFVPVRSGNLGGRLSKTLALRCDKRPRNVQIRRKNHSFLTFDAQKLKEEFQFEKKKFNNNNADRKFLSI